MNKKNPFTHKQKKKKRKGKRERREWRNILDCKRIIFLFFLSLTVNMEVFQV